MHRTTIRLDDVADRDQLVWAFWRAARGKRHRPEVQLFAQRLDEELDRLQREISTGTVAVGRTHRFEIRDPKRRTIHAPCFRERVLHHALMAQLAPVFERYLVPDSFACRPGKGSLAAIQRAQEHTRRYSWYLKMDMAAYFASIDHQVLKGLLRRRIKGRGVLALCDRIIDSHFSAPGRGLPIGALTSQHFANLYVAGLDRFLLEHPEVTGLVRYMDDVVVWGHGRGPLRRVLAATRKYVSNHLRLRIKPTWQLQRCERGLTLCGVRITPWTLRLSRRRRRRYRQARQRWEREFAAGHIDGAALQAGYASALAVTAHAEATAWRRNELARRPPTEA
jgi:RNA-directed DNA polymerase